MLTTKDIELMRFICRRKHPTRAEICKKFGADFLDSQPDKYVRFRDPRPKSPTSGLRVGEIPPSAEYYLTHDGIAEVDARKWFTTDYVIRNILVPIVVGAVSALVTSFIANGKLPFL